MKIFKSFLVLLTVAGILSACQQEVLDGTATVTLTGILTEYKGAAQFTLIDLDGVTTKDGKPWYK